MISKKERDFLLFLQEFPKREQYTPSIREIADGEGLAYATAYRLAQSLRARGYVTANKINGKNPLRYAVGRPPPEIEKT